MKRNRLITYLFINWLVCTAFFLQSHTASASASASAAAESGIIEMQKAPAQVFVGDWFTVKVIAKSAFLGPITIYIDPVDNGCAIKSKSLSAGIYEVTFEMTSGITPCRIHYELRNHPLCDTLSCPHPYGKASVTTAIRLPQSIRFDTPPPIYAEKDEIFTFSASSTSGLLVTATSNDACDIINSGNVKMGHGPFDINCKITLNQSGDDDYLPAEPVLLLVSLNSANYKPTGLCLDPNNEVSGKIIIRQRHGARSLKEIFIVQADQYQLSCFYLGSINIHAAFAVTIIFDPYPDTLGYESEEIINGIGYLSVMEKTISGNVTMTRARGTQHQRDYNGNNEFSYQITQKRNKKAYLGVRVSKGDIKAVE